jgi:hypothetical protein
MLTGISKGGYRPLDELRPKLGAWRKQMSRPDRRDFAIRIHSICRRDVGTIRKESPPNLRLRASPAVQICLTAGAALKDVIEGTS